MNGFLLEQPFPGATTGIVVGPLAIVHSATLAGFRLLQWWVDADDWHRTSVEFTRRPGLELVRLDQVPAAELAPTVERFITRDARHLPSLFVTTGLSAQEPTAYSAAIAAIHSAFEGHHVARVTRQKDGFTWQSHLLQNAPAYIQGRLPAAWRGVLRGLPALVCGAGPSLDVTARLLAGVADRGVVFAADSALRALARHGVTVDFAVSVDAAKQPAKCLAPDALPGRVVLSTVSPPAWRQVVPVDRWRFVSGRQVTDDWLAAHGVVRTAVAAQENCGSTALELARFLGCGPIYLFGLDLAVDASNPVHRHHAEADASLYKDSGFNPSQPLPTVPGNYATRVPTFAPGDWRALDERLAAWPANLVFNVNDRGARFHNTTLVHPDAFVFPATATDQKSVVQARLVGAEETSPATGAALAQLRHIGLRANREVGGLDFALAHEGPTAVVRRFRQILSDQDTARALGAFSFKLMPHLLPPTEGDAAFWRTLIEEFGLLAATAAQLPSTTDP